MMGAEGLLQKGKLSPPGCPTACGGRTVWCWQAALGAGMAMPLPLVRDLHGDPLPRAEISPALPAGRSDEGWEASSDRVFEGTKGCFIGPGLLIQRLPQRGHLLREVFYLCQTKEGKGRPVVLGLQNRFPSLKLCGQWGAALVAFFFHEPGGGLVRFSNTFLQPFPYCTAIYFCRQAVNQQLKPNPFSG